MAWFYLIVAGILEAFWAVGLKYTHGFSRLMPSVAVGALIISSMGLLSLSLRSIPVGTGYAVWVGMGIVGTVVLDAITSGQPPKLAQWAFLGLLLISVVGLKLTTPAR